MWHMNTILGFRQKMPKKGSRVVTSVLLQALKITKHHAYNTWGGGEHCMPPGLPFSINTETQSSKTGSKLCKEL